MCIYFSWVSVYGWLYLYVWIAKFCHIYWILLLFEYIFNVCRATRFRHQAPTMFYLSCHLGHSEISTTTNTMNWVSKVSFTKIPSSLVWCDLLWNKLDYCNAATPRSDSTTCYKMYFIEFIRGNMSSIFNWFHLGACMCIVCNVYGWVDECI